MVCISSLFLLLFALFLAACNRDLHIQSMLHCHRLPRTVPGSSYKRLAHQTLRL